MVGGRRSVRLLLPAAAVLTAAVVLTTSSPDHATRSGGTPVQAKLPVPVAPKALTPQSGQSDPAVDAWQAAIEPSVDAVNALSTRDKAFTSVIHDMDTHTLSIYRKGSTPTSLYAGIELPAGVHVVYRSAPMTEAETKYLMAVVAANRKGLGREGVEVTGVTQNGTGVLTVGVRNYTPEIDRLIRTRFNLYGTGSITVTPMEPLQPVVAVGRHR